MIKVLLTISMLFWLTVAFAIEPRTEHTYRLSEGESAPTASLDDLSWLVGSWSGTAFGNTFEEVWNPPSAGSMVGMFKVINNDAVEFYELMTLSHVDGRLTLKVKHFTADFVAWEDKPDFTKFPLVALDKDAVHFSGSSMCSIRPATTASRPSLSTSTSTSAAPERNLSIRIGCSCIVSAT